MNTFSKSLVALMVVSMVLASGSAFAGEKKHKKHDAKVEEKKAEEKKAEEKKAEEKKAEEKPAAAPAAKGK